MKAGKADVLRLRTAELRILRAMTSTLAALEADEIHVRGGDAPLAHTCLTIGLVDLERARQLVARVSCASVLGGADADDDEIARQAAEEERREVAS